MLTDRHSKYLKNYPTITDRNNKKFKVYPMKIKEYEHVQEILSKIAHAVTLLSLIMPPIIKEYTLEEQQEALIELSRLITTNDNSDINLAYKTNSMDIELLNKTIAYYLGFPDYSVDTKVESGVVLKDRNGNDHKVFSYKLTDYITAMQILNETDSAELFNNTNDDTTIDVLVDIAYMALDEKVTREEILSFADIEFLLKVTRVYYGLPVVA